MIHYKYLRLWISISLFTFSLISSAKSEVYLIENFENSRTVDWIHFTDDDNPQNGWIIKNGSLIQACSNGDKAPNGTRLLVKENVVSYAEINSLLNISFDICLLDFNLPEEAWFGFGIFCNVNNPLEKSLIVALRKDETKNISGVHISFDGKEWLDPKNNVEFSVLKFYTMKIQIEKDSAAKSFFLRTKIYSKTDKEPDKWLQEIKIPDNKISINSNGVFFGASAKLGKKTNPRAAFDNIVICDEFPQIEIEKSTDINRDIFLSLFEDDLSDEIEQRVYQLAETDSRFCGFDRQLFLDMLILRNTAHWPEAREKAAQLVKFFPKSPYAQKLGGNGKSEEEVAKEFSEAMKAYHDGNFSQARDLFIKFNESYPNNWRRDHCQYLASDCIYQQHQEEKFIEEVNDLINNNKINPPYSSKLLYQQAAALVRLKKGDSARDVLDYLEAGATKDKFKSEINQLRLESYIYYDDHPSSLTISNIAPMMNQCLNTSRQVDRWYVKNLNFYIKHFTENPQKFLLNEIELVKDKPELKWKAGLVYATYLLKTKRDKQSAIEWTENFLNSDKDEFSKERRKLKDFLAQIYFENENKEKFEELRSNEK